MKAQRLLSLFISSLLATCATQAAEDLTDLDLATLMSMDVTVTSAARRAQATADAAAAVFVITREDIHRSGATSLPEVLRLAPGLQVARIDARSWAITARGFNSRFANKLQVLVDGRSIYTPLFSGVMWEEQHVPLDNIERIEVLRGPGGALWGINAVNGVINIITRPAADDSGVQLQAGSGTVDSAGLVSYADRIDPLGDYRVYAEHTRTDSYLDGGEPWIRTQAGWRLDRAAGLGRLSFQGDVAKSDFGDIDGYADSNLPGNSRTGNVTLNWQRDMALGSIDAHTYYSWADRGMPGRWSEATAGLELQFSANRIGRHLLTGGVGLRELKEEQRDPAARVRFSAIKSSQDQWSIYAQDEINFFDDRLRVIAGAKVEDFTYSDLAFQPTLRTLWHLSPTQTLWGAVSRAVRTPSRIELFSRVNVTVPEAVPVVFQLRGNRQLAEEKLNAYELGWRWRPNPRLSLDASLYHNDYQDLISVVGFEPVFAPGPPAQIEKRFVYLNSTDTTVYGVEAGLEWAATDWLRWQVNGNWHHMTNQPPAAELSLQIASDPNESLGTHFRVDLPHRIELDLGWRYVDSLTSYDIPSYSSFDVRAGWHVRDDFELSFTVNNALDDAHVEFYDETSHAMGARIGRSFFGRFVWHPGR